MTFETTPQPSPPSRQKIAVIGSGIAGLSAAWGLSKGHDVTLLEREDYAGGHANTVDVNIDGKMVAVDTGFIVYNEANYPNFVAFMKHLGVKTAASDMSFAVSLESGAMEYSGQTASSVFATRKNLISPRFWRMLVDIPRFHRLAQKALSDGMDKALTLGDFIKGNNLSDAFTQNFIIPMAGAIWSAPTNQILEFPADAIIRFFHNHGLLQVLNMPEWRTIDQGSRNYIQALLEDFDGEILLNCGVTHVSRIDDGVMISREDGQTELYDRAVIATHGDKALALLQDASEREKSVLSAFQYMKNKAILHLDDRHMPVKKNAWSAWNVLRHGDSVSLTYWMNKLQPLKTQKNIFVTLNPDGPVENVMGTYDYDHPLYTHEACRAQRDIWSIQGEGGVWYCGAHLGSGFHEDGLQAGLGVAEAIGGFRRPWRVENESGRIFQPVNKQAIE